MQWLDVLLITHDVPMVLLRRVLVSSASCMSAVFLHRIHRRSRLYKSIKLPSLLLEVGT